MLASHGKVSDRDLTGGGDSSEAGRDLAAAQLRRQQVEAAVQTWSGQLIDLGGRNQLLRYRVRN